MGCDLVNTEARRLQRTQRIKEHGGTEITGVKVGSRQNSKLLMKSLRENFRAGFTSILWLIYDY